MKNSLLILEFFFLPLLTVTRGPMSRKILNLQYKHKSGALYILHFCLRHSLWQMLKFKWNFLTSKRNTHTHNKGLRYTQHQMSLLYHVDYDNIQTQIPSVVKPWDGLLFAFCLLFEFERAALFLVIIC